MSPRVMEQISRSKAFFDSSGISGDTGALSAPVRAEKVFWNSASASSSSRGAVQDSMRDAVNVVRCVTLTAQLETACSL